MSLVPAQLIDCVRWEKKGKQGCREQGEDGECDKEQWGETEDSYVL